MNFARKEAPIIEAPVRAKDPVRGVGGSEPPDPADGGNIRPDRRPFIRVQIRPAERGQPNDVIRSRTVDEHFGRYFLRVGDGAGPPRGIDNALPDEVYGAIEPLCIHPEYVEKKIYIIDRSSPVKKVIND